MSPMVGGRGNYAPVPVAHVDAEADRELEAAFGVADSDGESDDESTPLRPTMSFTTSPPPVNHAARPLAASSGTYDFERLDYDHPPPGSPPPPSTSALPNDWGNSNGVTGTVPAVPPAPRPSILRRTIGALLPQHYAPLPTQASSSRVVGGGLSNDGVFGNVVAKPSRGVEVQTEDGNVYMAPEESQREQPPSYRTAQMDTVPPYYDTATVSAFDPVGADMIIEDLPTGSVIFFLANAFISFFFQFVGFLMTYIMHTSHAAKYGSRAGLGLTLIQYGWYSRQAAYEMASLVDEAYNAPAPTDAAAAFANGTWTSAGQGRHWGSMNGNSTQNSWPVEEQTQITPEMAASFAATRAWIAFLLMAFGWIVLVSSVYGFWRVKRWETSIRSSAHPGGSSTGVSSISLSGLRQRVRQALSRRNRGTEGGSAEEMVAMTAGSGQAPPAVPETPSTRMERMLREAHMIV